MPATSGISKLFICVGASPDDSAEQGGEWTGVQAGVAPRRAVGAGVEAGAAHLVDGHDAAQPDPSEGGSILFWKLNAEAYIMASGVPYTIVKPCGLVKPLRRCTSSLATTTRSSRPCRPSSGAPRWRRCCTAAKANATTLRFDLCSKAGPATTDFAALAKAHGVPVAGAEQQQQQQQAAVEARVK